MDILVVKISPILTEISHVEGRSFIRSFILQLLTYNYYLLGLQTFWLPFFRNQSEIYEKSTNCCDEVSRCQLQQPASLKVLHPKIFHFTSLFYLSCLTERGVYRLAAPNFGCTKIVNLTKIKSNKVRGSFKELHHELQKTVSSVVNLIAS